MPSSKPSLDIHASNDLAGLQMTHYALRPRGELQGVDQRDGDEEDPALRPATAAGTGDPRDRERAFLSEIIERLGLDLNEKDNVRFFERVTKCLCDNADLMAQVENKTMDQAMPGDLPGAVTNAIVDSLSEDQERSERLLSDGEVMQRFVRLVFQVLRESDVERARPAGGLDV